MAIAQFFCCFLLFCLHTHSIGNCIGRAKRNIKKKKMVNNFIIQFKLKINGRDEYDVDCGRGGDIKYQASWRTITIYVFEYEYTQTQWMICCFSFGFFFSIFPSGRKVDNLFPPLHSHLFPYIWWYLWNQLKIIIGTRFSGQSCVENPLKWSKSQNMRTWKYPRPYCGRINQYKFLIAFNSVCVMCELWREYVSVWLTIMQSDRYTPTRKFSFGFWAISTVSAISPSRRLSPTLVTCSNVK